ncbi:hypothetical protein D027_2498A, partial [Vibrio parahaemolyticus 861]|jgi:ABC-type uncharacterized transport system substrate-binding protein
MRSS